jgi:decaheme cytochrome c component MtrC/MtrF-like protein
MRPAVVLALLGCAAIAASAIDSQAAGPFSFPHRPHLTAATIAAGGTGSDADCRTCHDYSAAVRESHLSGCEKCHVDKESGKHLEWKVTGAYERPAFQHKEHLFTKEGAARKDISCFTCHEMRRDADWIEFSVPTAGLGPKSRDAKGARTCADCHATHEPKGGVVRQDETTGDGKACAQCHLGNAAIEPLKYRGDVRAAGGRPFEHEDHGAASADCNGCHAPIRQSKTVWDYDPTKGTAQMCVTCHVDEAGKPLVAAAARTSTITKIDFSRFPHATHLGEFSKMDCRTCHYPETDDLGRRTFPQRAASPEPTGRDQLLRFAACDACHGHENWAPQKPSWHVEGHGVGAWACFKCHEGQADKDGKLPVAAASVSRSAVGPSKFTVHFHPGITKRGATLADPNQPAGGKTLACGECHLGNLDELTSRITTKPFAHDPHLPASPTNENCVQCHATSATSRRSEDLKRFDAHVDAAPAPVGAAANVRGCLECHVGATAADLGLDVAPAERKVPQFDHAGHVRAASLVAGTQGIACSQCHVKGGELGYTTPPDVLACTKCHAHEGDAAKVARTGPKTSQGDAKKCLLCHDQVRGDANGRVGTPPRETITRTHLELRPGTQRHDKGGDCAACHGREGAAATPYKERIAKALVQMSIHDDPDFAGRPFNDPKGDCKQCHRTEPRGYLRSLAQR